VGSFIGSAKGRENMLRRFSVLCALAIAAAPSIGWSQSVPDAAPYRILKTIKAGGAGGFDYINADVEGRRLYIPRRGEGARITIFDLDTLTPAGTIPGVNGHGAVVDPKTNHAFTSSKPVVMWDTKTLQPIKSIEVNGNPDGIFFDAFDQRVYVFSHIAPTATVIDSKDGSVVGTIDLGGAPEQAVSDGNGHVYVDVEDKANVAVVDARTLAVTAHYDLAGKGGTCAGLALDVKNRILFAACRNPQNMVVLSADDGKILAALPIGRGTDGAVFNPTTMEAFSSQVDGTLSIIKENSPTDFVLEQTLQTMPSAKTLTLDSRTNHLLLMGGEFPPAPPRPAAGGQGNPNPMVPDSFSILVVGK
jgi:DNA-binding beta-propeller fold protein YncE